MRHRKSGRKLGRKTGPRRALMKTLVRGLFLVEPTEDCGHLERIITTPAKAKEARKLAEKLITLGKKGDLAARRRAMSLVGDKKVVKKLFETIAPRYADRPGGYTRILHWHKHRLGDNAPQVLFELVEAEMPESKKKSAPAAPQAAPAAEEPDSKETEAEEQESEATNDENA